MNKCRCGTSISHFENFCESCRDEISESYKKQADPLQKAGTFGYEPANQYERAAHKRAVRQISYGNGCVT